MPAGVWIGRAGFLAMAIAILLIALVPLGFTPRFIPGPDMLLVLIFAYLFRRPEFAPVWLLVPVLLVQDILTLRPLGLWTAIILIAAEFARGQEFRMRERIFLAEWGLVAFLIFLAMLANRLVLSLALVPPPGLVVDLLHVVVTALAYPIMVFFCYFALRVRKVTPEQAIRFGHRL